MRAIPRALSPLPLTTLLVSLILAGTPWPAQAGCGCEKLPPPPAAVRPNATYAGAEVTLFHASLVSEQAYTVLFTSGITGESATVPAVAVTRRDLGDGQYKSQLVVPVPPLPLGPTTISVSAAGQSGALLSVPDDAFTLAPAPLAVPSQVGEYHYQNFQAAVSRGGVVYLSLDLTTVTLPRTFQAQAKGYPLRLSSDGVVFYNTQGVLMQLLEQSMPGLFAITAANTAVDSDLLQYSRHEFNTFYLQHEERQIHQLDPTDPNWHLDGTRHLDHNHLVLAIRGTLNDGSLPPPGATPAFELVLNTFSLFDYGLVAIDSMEMRGGGQTDSYNSKTGLPGLHGDVRTNGTLTMSQSTVINGDATAAAFAMSNSALISGAKTLSTQPLQFMAVSIPASLPDLGSITVGSGQTSTLVGPASYKVASITVSGNGQLFIDNSQGPVTLYVTGAVQVSATGDITIADPTPEKFALYVAGSGDVSLFNKTTFHGVVYAPQSAIYLYNNVYFYGAFVGATVKTDAGARIHYDTALRGQ